MTKQKNLALEGLRGLASLSVAIGHFTFVVVPFLGTVFTPIPGATARFAFERWASYPPFTLLFSAEAAVYVFFAMSGYVLTTKYYATGAVADLQSAAAKRYLRLVLPTFASVMCAWFLFGRRLVLYVGWALLQCPGVSRAKRAVLDCLFRGRPAQPRTRLAQVPPDAFPRSGLRRTARRRL